jgi:hypothetical protein
MTTRLAAVSVRPSPPTCTNNTWCDDDKVNNRCRCGSDEMHNKHFLQPFTHRTSSCPNLVDDKPSEHAKC